MIIKVGMADLNIAKTPNILQTCGLGSCVGICLWDSSAKVAGMAHIMLPTSSIGNMSNKAKFADTAIPVLIDKMKKNGADERRLVAKIAGGAQMFSFSNSSDIMKIGERNTEAVKKCLQSARIRIAAEDTGGSYGRTIEFYADTGSLYIRTVSLGEKFI